MRDYLWAKGPGNIGRRYRFRGIGLGPEFEEVVKLIDIETVGNDWRFYRDSE